MSDDEIRIGTRGSRLALVQAQLVAAAWKRQGRRTRLVTAETEGDRRTPDTAWGEGAFVAAIERALLDGRADVAVHSAKDIPTQEDPRLWIGAYLPRADPRDALVVRTDATERRLDDLPPGVRVGTDSPRRTGFLLAHRPDVHVHPLHGNVDTRLRRLDAGETDALVLACAGLDRLGLGDRIAERLAPDVMPPAPGQGAIAVQIRRDDARMLGLAAAIDHHPTRVAVEAERAFLAASGGGCRAPIGALAELDGAEVVLLGGHARPDGSSTAVARRRGPAGDGPALALELALELGSDSGTRRASIDRFESSRRVLVTRAVEQSAELMRELRARWLEPVPVPAIAVEYLAPDGPLDRCARLLHGYRWVVITSANGARAILNAAERVFTSLKTPGWVVIGPATRRVLEQAGIAVDFQPAESSGSAMARELPVGHGDRILIVRGDLADDDLAVSLRARGAEVDDVVAYRTLEGPQGSRPLLRRAFAGGSLAALVFTSGSTVRGLVDLAAAESLDIGSVPAVCIGPETADAARAAGFRVVAVAPTPDSAALAAATAGALALWPQETA